MPSSKRAAFGSGCTYSYWRRIHKLFLDYIGSGKARDVPAIDLPSVPLLNKHLSLSTPSIFFGTISSRVGFVEWHQSKGGWVSYANDFPFSWPGYEMVIGSSPNFPIKKGMVKEIGSVAPSNKGKGKKG